MTKTKILEQYKDNIIAEYDFSKGTYSDQGTNGNDLTTPTDIYFKNSKKGRVINFSQTTSKFHMPNVAIGNEFTIISIVMPKQLDASDNVMMADGGVGGYLQWDINNADEIRFYSNDLSPIAATESITASDYIGKWNVLGCTRSGTSTKIFSNGVLLGTTTQTGTNNNTFGRMGIREAGDKNWVGDMRYHLILNTGLSDGEMAQLYEELEQSAHLDYVPTKTNGYGENLILHSEQFESWLDTDADVTTNSITAPDGTLTADTLQGTDLNNSTVFAPLITPHEVGDYTFSVYLKADTEHTARLRCNAWTNNWSKSITVTTEWQRFELTFTEDTDGIVSTMYNRIYPDFSGATNHLVYAWGAQLERTKGASTYKKTEDIQRVGGVITNYYTNGLNWNESVANEGVGFLSNTGWTINSGTWKINTDKQIENVSNGLLSRPSTIPYGTWEFDIYKDSRTDIQSVQFISTTIALAPPDSYRFTFHNTNHLVLYKGGSIRWKTEADYLAHNEWYRIKITRSTNGEFTVYYSTDNGVTYTLIVEDGTGTITNPGIDNILTTSNYMVLDFDSSDKIKNFVFKPYID